MQFLKDGHVFYFGVPSLLYTMLKSLCLRVLPYKCGVCEMCIWVGCRSLAYCTLLGVLWQMYHAWITYGMVRRTVQMMADWVVQVGKTKETCLFACFWDPYGSLAMLGPPIGAFVQLS